jgi:phage FluMu protein gp41
MTRDDTAELRNQVREWEQDELNRVVREQGRSSTVLGSDGVYHHRDYLGSVLARTNDVTIMANDDTEYDQTLAYNEGVELLDHQLTELREITGRVGNHFTTEALGQPSDMQISSGLSWS